MEYVHRYTRDAPPDAIPVGCAGASKPDHQRYCSWIWVHEKNGKTNGTIW